MKVSKVSEALIELENLRAEVSTLNIAHKQEVKQAVPADVVAKIEEIDASYQEKTFDLKAQIKDLESEIKAAVVACGGTIRGRQLQGVWVKGQVSWDGGHLEEIAITTPEIWKARKVGDPHCRITKAT